jgi:hypothetical protein
MAATAISMVPLWPVTSILISEGPLIEPDLDAGMLSAWVAWTSTVPDWTIEIS